MYRAELAPAKGEPAAPVVANGIEDPALAVRRVDGPPAFGAGESDGPVLTVAGTVGPWLAADVVEPSAVVCAEGTRMLEEGAGAAGGSVFAPMGDRKK